MVAAERGDALYIQFAREPVPGQVKTRMLPALDPAEAAELHRELVLWTTQSLVVSARAPVELYVTGNPSSPLFEACRGSGAAAVRLQQGRDLGERMCRALAAGLETHRKVVLVGSDCPQIDPAYLAAALEALDDHDAVLGPAADGGYVLVGVTRIEQRWFEDIEWGTSEVYAQSLARFEETGAKLAALEVLQDIDRPEDLPLWRGIQAMGR